MRILIAGCGDIGTKLGLELSAAGHNVYGLRRNSQQLPASVKPISADLSVPLATGILPESLDQIIYILAAASFNEAAYRQAYVGGVKHLVNALGQTKASLKRFIFVSSSSVYAQNKGQWVDESSATHPKNFNGQIMLEAEEQVLSLANSVVVRFSGIYGPGRTRMINQVKDGQLAAREPEIFSNRIHRDDCVRVLSYLSQLNQLNDRIIVASDHQPVSLFEIHSWLADQFEISPEDRHYQIPKRRAGSKRLSNKRLLELGFEFKYPNYQSGYREILESLG